MKRAALALAFAALVALGCSARPPCEEAITGPLGDVALIASNVEPANVKLVHLVTFEMGPVSETLQGYMILRAPDALRIYGMAETGQEAFDVAVLRGKVTRVYRAPFLKDDRVLDQIVHAAEKIFLIRPYWGPELGWCVASLERRENGFLLKNGWVDIFYAGPNLDLRWLQGEKFSACFMDWSREGGVYAPRRIHFHSDEGPYPYELRMKLTKATLLSAPPPDSLFEPR